MKKKVILGSALTILMCSSLITGATMALFGTEAGVNISVTSGKVDVSATVKTDTVQTKQLYETEYTSGADNTYMKGVTVQENGEVVLDGMVLGDGIKFDIEIVNKSTVDVKYRTKVTCLEGFALYGVLDIDIDGGQSLWTTWTRAEEDTRTVSVTIELPETVSGTDYQGVTSKLVFSVEAVQGNAKTEDEVMEQLPGEASGTTTVPEDNTEDVIVTTDNGFASVVIPADNVDSGASEVSFSVSPLSSKEEEEFNLENEAVYYGIETSGISELTEPVEISLYIGKDLIDANVYQNESGDVVAVDDVQYSSETGYVTFKTRSFSPFAVEGISRDVIVTVTDDARENGIALQKAVMNATPGQVITVPYATYDIPMDNKTVVQGQKGWYLPVVENDITIIGIDNPVITSTDVSTNGIWSSQNFITIFGDNVTIEGVIIKCKMDSNKAFEISGKNSTLKDVEIRCNDYVSYEQYLKALGIEKGSETDYWEFYSKQFAGSVYYSGDVGNFVLENVIIDKAWISTTSVNAGTILADGLTIDFVGCGYSGYSGYVAISGNAKDVFKVGKGLTVKVDSTYTDIGTLLNSAPAGASIELAAGEYDLSNVNNMNGSDYGLKITRPVTISGAGQQTILKFGNNGNAISGQAEIMISSDDVVLKGLSVVAGHTSNANVSAVKVTYAGNNGVKPQNVTLENLYVTAGAGHAINVHGATNVKIDGCVLESYAKCGIAIANTQGVAVSNTTFKSTQCWADIGLMYAANKDYAEPSSLVLGAGNVFALNMIYSERPETADGGKDTVDWSAYEDTMARLDTDAGWVIGKKVAKIGDVAYPSVISAVDAAKPGETVTILEGTHKVEHTIVITKGINIVGEDGAVLDCSNAVLPTEGGYNTSAAVLILSSNVTIQNITVIGRADANVNAILTIGFDNVEAEGLTDKVLTVIEGVQYSFDWAVGEFYPEYKGLYENIRLIGCKFALNELTENGLATGLFLNGRYIIIDGCTFENIKATSAVVKIEEDHTKVLNSTFTNCEGTEYAEDWCGEEIDGDGNEYPGHPFKCDCGWAEMDEEAHAAHIAYAEKYGWHHYGELGTQSDEQ